MLNTSLNDTYVKFTTLITYRFWMLPINGAKTNVALFFHSLSSVRPFLSLGLSFQLGFCFSFFTLDSINDLLLKFPSDYTVFFSLQISNLLENCIHFFFRFGICFVWLLDARLHVCAYLCACERERWRQSFFSLDVLNMSLKSIILFDNTLTWYINERSV